MTSKNILSRNCIICSAEFNTTDTKRGRKKQTCSRSCSSRLAYKNQTVNGNCCRCHADVQTRRSVINGKLLIYCDNCRNLRYEIKCNICGIKFYASHKETFLCSTTCKTRHNQLDKVIVHCDYCGKAYEQAKFNIYKDKKHYCSQKCNQNSFAMRNPNRYGKTWYIWTKLIKNRDDNKCLLCRNSANLEVHHFIKLKAFNKPDDAHYFDNLGTFCHSCHLQIENENISSFTEFNERYSPNS